MSTETIRLIRDGIYNIHISIYIYTIAITSLGPVGSFTVLFQNITEQ